MSSFQTHMLIGAVAGLALGRALDAAGISLVNTSMVPHIGAAPWLSSMATSVPLIILSALLATLPDIDEPGSFIARRVRTMFTLTGMAFGGFVAWTAKLPPLSVLLAVVAGAIGGAIIGYVALRIIRHAAGGHRRFTHSLVLASGLLVGAVALWSRSQHTWALLPGALAWGIIVHNIGDIVTPAGVPLFHPFSSKCFRVLPEPICRVGEPLVALTTSVVALVLLGVVRM